MEQNTAWENLVKEKEYLNRKLEILADDQARLFQTYQANGEWETAIADPTSAISQINMDILIYHQLFSVWHRCDMNEPLARALARKYIDREYDLIEQAEGESADGRFAK